MGISAVESSMRCFAALASSRGTITPSLGQLLIGASSVGSHVAAKGAIYEAWKVRTDLSTLPNRSEDGVSAEGPQRSNDAARLAESLLRHQCMVLQRWRAE